MRLLLLAVLALSLSACDLFGPGGVDTAVVQSIQVEALDLTKPWDNPFTQDLPDIYVDLNDDQTGTFLAPDYRSDVRENVAALPLTFRTSGDYAIPLDAVATLTVNDRDNIGDDVMFASGSFTLADQYSGEERGEPARIVFENEDGRVVLFVRWD